MADFNPDEFLKRTSKKESGDTFNPDAFLERTAPKVENGPSPLVSAVRKFAQGASYGFSDELAGGIEAAGRVFGVKGAGGDLANISIDPEGPTLDTQKLRAAYEYGRNVERENLKKDQESNPKTSIVAEIAGGISSPLNKAAKGMSALKAGALMGGAYGLGTSESDSMGGMALDTAKGAGIGAGAGYIGGKIANAIAPSNVASKISPTIIKKNSDQIISAADRLGIKLTPAMLDDTGFVERLESSLAKSPSFFGQSISRKQREAIDVLRNAIKEATVDATNLSEYQVGERVKSGITSKIGERLDPISSLFDEVAESTKHIPIGQKSKDAIIRNIQKADDYALTQGAGKPSQYVDMISRAENANQVKSIMTMLNKDIQATQGAEQQVLIGIKNKLSTLEKNSIMRAAISQAKEGGMRTTTGNNIGLEIVNDLKGARSGYRALMSDLGEVGLDSRIKSSGGPSRFLNELEKIPSDRIEQRLFNTDNFRQVKTIAEKFPEEFNLLKQGKIRDVLQGSIDSTSNGQGALSPQRFLNEIKKLSPEAKQILFSGKTQLLDDIQTIQQSMPRNFNPSGTASEIGLQEAIYRNAKDIPNYLLYKGASSNIGKSVGKALSSSAIDGARDVTSSGVRAIQNPLARLLGDAASSKELRGYEKWTNVGAQNLVDQGVEVAVIDEMLKSKKGRQLILDASDAAPNSQRMKSVLKRIGSLKEAN